MKQNSENAYREWIYITLVDLKVGYLLRKRALIPPPPTTTSK